MHSTCLHLTQQTVRPAPSAVTKLQPIKLMHSEGKALSDESSFSGLLVSVSKVSCTAGRWDRLLAIVHAAMRLCMAQQGIGASLLYPAELMMQLVS